MKSFWKDNPYFKISLYAIFVAVVTILFYRISSNTDNIAPSIIAFFRRSIRVILPILYGLLIAYLFNPIMIFFERYFLKWFKPSTTKQKKAIRSIAIMTVYVCILGTIVLMIRYLIPQISKNIMDLVNVMPKYLENLKEQIAAFEKHVNSNISMFPYTLDTAQLFDMIDPEKLFNKDLINNIIASVMNSTLSITSSLYNLVMGLVIAFYMLTQKEDFSLGIKRLMFSLLKKERAEKIIAIFTEGNEIFIQFFVGKFIDSSIIGVICFIGLSILDNPYALLLSFIVGVLNMIPYFGPFLGAIPAVVITLFTGFMPAVFVAIFIFLLQQFDGLVLGPKILGDSIGLSPFWIISGIIVGGALWGPLGMFFASPIVAVILNNITRWVDRTLAERNIPHTIFESAITSNDTETKYTKQTKPKLKKGQKNNK